jgi:hypothetical protein
MNSIRNGLGMRETEIAKRVPSLGKRGGREPYGLPADRGLRKCRRHTVRVSGGYGQSDEARLVFNKQMLGYANPRALCGGIGLSSGVLGSFPSSSSPTGSLLE